MISLPMTTRWIDEKCERVEDEHNIFVKLVTGFDELVIRVVHKNISLIFYKNKIS